MGGGSHLEVNYVDVPRTEDSFKGQFVSCPVLITSFADALNK